MLLIDRNTVHVSCVGTTIIYPLSQKESTKKVIWMVSSVNSINQYQVNYKELEVMRRLQSLGINPSGNLSADRQTLQIAETEKKRSTLATNSEVNLSRIEGTRSDFSSTVKALGNLTIGSEAGLPDHGYGMMNVAGTEKDMSSASYAMVGATQIAELNKLKFGLIA
jgi:hypothetical protein